MPWVTKSSAAPEPQPQAPQREYTKKEKAANWWYYHKWYVVLGVVAVVVVVYIVTEMLGRVKPDIKVAYVAAQELPVDTANALTAALQAYTTDLNGDGQVVVQLDQYTVQFTNANENADAYSQMAGVTRLSAELAPGGSTYLFLLEDAAGFEGDTGVLQYLDGTLPDEDADATTLDWQQMVYRWADCPVLAGLDLGSYTGETLLDDATGESQSLLANVYVARRGIWDEADTENFAGGPELWAALTAGATPLAD